MLVGGLKLGATMKLRKIVTTIVIATLFFWAPTFIPVPVKADGIFPCGRPLVWLSADTAFAVPVSPCGPTMGNGGSAWVWGIFGCSAGIVIAAVVKNAKRHKELTAQEAWTCGLLYWLHP
jgi:hypothetical protein